MSISRATIKHFDVNHKAGYRLIMDLYALIKTLHIIGSTVIFGTGLGIAFFMFRSKMTSDISQKLYAAKTTVLADYIFTLPAVIIQPITGIWLIHLTGYDWTETWLHVTYALYGLAGLCWLPVVWIQIELKTMIMKAHSEGTPLPERYHVLFKRWFLLGWPAFLSLIVIFYLMVAKPI